jgi:hypothetical protein
LREERLGQRVGTAFVPFDARAVVLA